MSSQTSQEPSVMKLKIQRWNYFESIKSNNEMVHYLMGGTITDDLLARSQFLFVKSISLNINQRND